MKKTNVLTSVLALSVSAVPGLAADEADVMVRWGGSSSSNMVSAARDLPADPGAVPPLWEIRLGSHQYTIPTIDRGRIYIGADDAGLDRPGVKVTGGGIIACADVATGKVLWTFVSPRYMEGVKAPYHFDQWKCGICSGPVVDGDRVYAVGNRGEVLCLDREGQANGNEGPFLDELRYMDAESGTALLPTDGDIVWKRDLLAEDMVIPHDVCGSTILLQGDLIWICTSNGIDDLHAKIPSPLAPSLVVLDKRTGRLVARDGEEIGKRMLHGHWSSPAFGIVRGKPIVFFGGGDGILYAFEPPDQKGSGQILRKVWSYDCNPPDYRVRDGKPLPYSRSSENSPDGPSEIIGTPVLHEGRVFVAIGQSPIHGAGRGQLSAIDAATGAKVWSSTLVDRTLATPAIAGGLLFIPDYTGNLHAFEAATGERVWVHPLGGKTWGSSAFAADGKVYVGTEANVLWVLEAARERKVLSRTRWKSVPITPAAMDGLLFIPTQKSLIAVPGTAAADAPGAGD